MDDTYIYRGDSDLMIDEFYKTDCFVNDCYCPDCEVGCTCDDDVVWCSSCGEVVQL